jgi:AcrR family transcriptional regulator
VDGAAQFMSLDAMPQARSAPRLVKATRRTEILETAAALFGTAGVRTSLKEIADACGILPGSIYHHFSSKEAIIIELIERYQQDLDRVAATAMLRRPSAKPSDDGIVAFGRDVASCAVRHPGASLMALFEPPIGASEELRQLVSKTPHAIHRAMHGLLKLYDDAGQVRRGVDLSLLSERLCEGMMRHGLIDTSLNPPPDQLPALRCQLLLHGVATRAPTKSALDCSNALKAVKNIVADWERNTSGDERLDHLLAVARTEFARRGYEVATLREIAAAAELSLGAVYRAFPSKGEMLRAIMTGYMRQREAAWSAVMNSRSSPLEKLDALTWMHINLLEKFGDEVRIQFGFIRETPGNKRRITTPSRLRQTEALLTAGVRSGELRMDGEPPHLYARCVYEALWTGASIIKRVGVRKAHAFTRDTLFAGALVRT